MLWPGGAYIDATKAKIMIPYYEEIVNHDYIDSLGCIPNEPKSRCSGTAGNSTGLDTMYTQDFKVEIPRTPHFLYVQVNFTSDTVQLTSIFRDTVYWFYTEQILVWE